MHQLNNTTDKDKDFSIKKFAYYQDELKEIWKYNIATTKSRVLEADEHQPHTIEMQI